MIFPHVFLLFISFSNKQKTHTHSQQINCLFLAFNVPECNSVLSCCHHQDQFISCSHQTHVVHRLHILVCIFTMFNSPIASWQPAMCVHIYWQISMHRAQPATTGSGVTRQTSKHRACLGCVFVNSPDVGLCNFLPDHGMEERLSDLSEKSSTIST